MLQYFSSFLLILLVDKTTIFCHTSHVLRLLYKPGSLFFEIFTESYGFLFADVVKVVNLTVFFSEILFNY